MSSETRWNLIHLESGESRRRNANKPIKPERFPQSKSHNPQTVNQNQSINQMKGGKRRGQGFKPEQIKRQKNSHTGVENLQRISLQSERNWLVIDRILIEWRNFTCNFGLFSRGKVWWDCPLYLFIYYRYFSSLLLSFFSPFFLGYWSYSPIAYWCG